MAYNSTNSTLVFPDPDHLNYTKLSTDCKGNEINFNLTLETSTGYHIVTFPTVGVPDGSTTTKLPSTDNEYITESTSTITTNLVTEVPVTPNPDSWSTESTTVSPIVSSTIEVTNTTPGEVSTQLPEETTTTGSSTSSESTTSEESVETTVGLEITTTSEGLSELSTMDPSLISTTDNTNLAETTTVFGTTTQESAELSTVSEINETTTASPDLTTDNPLILTTPEDNLAETTTIDLQSTSEPTEILITTQEPMETSSQGEETKTTTMESLETTTQGVEVETTTQEPGETTTELVTTEIIMTTESYPLPSQLSTDDFVFGHWFSTEEVRAETTTEPTGIGITATIGNVDIPTTTAVEDGVPLPGELNLNGEPSPATTQPSLPTTTVETGSSLDGFPEPSYLPPTNPPPKAEKMLILKLQVPDDVDVNSSQFIKNITSSLRRLVRDVSTELKKRRKRSSSFDTLQQQDTLESNDVLSIPIKVENITKTLNITVVTFALQFDTDREKDEYELENALHEVGTYDLHRYFAFEPIEKIIINAEAVEDHKVREVILASGVAFLLFLIVVFFYLKKKGVWEKVFRKIDRMRCNSLATRPSAFSPN